MDVCGSDGKIERLLLSKATIPQVPSLYSALRKTTWGGLYPAFAPREMGRVVNSHFDAATATRNRARVIELAEERAGKQRNSAEDKKAYVIVLFCLVSSRLRIDLLLFMFRVRV